MTIVSQHYEYVVGVDTHADTHTLAVLSRAGELLRTASFSTTVTALTRAIAWIRKYAPGELVVAMEGTGSYGAQFCALLEGAGYRVAETKPPGRGVRRAGKTDALDAEHAARHALALPVTRLVTPRAQSGSRVVLTALLGRRDALTTKTAAAGKQLLALLRGHDFGVDARKVLPLSGIVSITKWRSRSSDSSTTAKLRRIVIDCANEYVTDYRALQANLKSVSAEVEAEAAWLLEEPGVGPCTAARFLVSWSHAGRFRSADAFARHAGVAPIPASSGKTKRHRLHRGGDRKLNQAMWRIAFNRYYHPSEETQAFINKHAAAKTPREIIRILKHHITRKLFRAAERASAAAGNLNNVTALPTQHALLPEAGESREELRIAA